MRSAHKISNFIPRTANGWAWKHVCDVVVEGLTYICLTIIRVFDSPPLSPPRIPSVQELELLGEDAVPPLLYEGDESVFATIEEEGERDERGDEKADFEAGVVQMDDLRLAAEEQNKEVLPAVGEAEK